MKAGSKIARAALKVFSKVGEISDKIRITVDTRVQRRYEFGPFILEPAERLLRCEGRPVQLTPKVFDVLVALVRQSGHVLTKDELMGAVWPDTFIEEGSLARNVSTLRKTLAEFDNVGRYIETVSKRGYRFAAEVHERAADGRTETRDGAPAIAVLPFKLLDAEGGDEYLGLGLADALITKFGQVRGLVVRPTSAVRRYGGAEVSARAAGRELSVDFVLEGSVRRRGERLRVTVQLVATTDGATRWADKFDERFTDIFDVEDSISEQVARALTLRLSEAERMRLTRRHTEDTEAYRLYLKGRYFWNRRTHEALRKGLEYFERAVDADPNFALAYTGLADSYLLGAGSFLPLEAIPKARAAALRAVELDETLAEAHTSVARIRMSFEWDWVGAERGFKRALELNPNYSTARQWYANLLIATGRAEEAIEQIVRAQEVDPLSLVINSAAGWIYYLARDYDRAVEQYQKALEMEPGFLQARRELGMVYGQKGLREEALDALTKAVTASGEEPLTQGLLGRVYAAFGERREAEKILARLKPLAESVHVLFQVLAAIYIALGDEERALEKLERAVEARSASVVWLKVDPWFDDLRTSTRFRKILTRVGL